MQDPRHLRQTQFCFNGIRTGRSKKTFAKRSLLQRSRNFVDLLRAYKFFNTIESLFKES